MSRTPLAVPFGLAPDGTFVLPWNADPAAAYLCPGCGAPLRLRQSKVRRPHFAHRRGEGCSPESLLHRSAKQLVVRVVEEWKAGTGGRPCIDRPCPVWSCDGGVIQDLTYDSDMRRVRAALERAAVGVPWRMQDKETIVLMTAFSDPSVNFDVAVWIDDPWRALRALSDLHEAVWWALKEEGILIAFPQIDVHFDQTLHERLDRLPRAG